MAFDSTLLLFRHGLHALLELARSARRGKLRGLGALAEVALWRTASCVADVAAILARARGGHAWTMRLLPVPDA